MLQFYLFFCIFKHFDHENKFLLWNCVWNLNFVVLRLFHQKILLFLFFSLNHKCYFLLFFVPRLFKDISVAIWTKYIFLKRIDSIYEWCIIYPHFVSLSPLNNRSKVNNNSNVHKIVKSCLIFMNMS